MENKIIVNYENVKPFAIVTINDVTERVPVRIGHANRTTANGPELWIQLENTRSRLASGSPLTYSPATFTKLPTSSSNPAVLHRTP